MVVQKFSLQNFLYNFLYIAKWHQIMLKHNLHIAVMNYLETVLLESVNLFLLMLVFGLQIVSYVSLCCYIQQPKCSYVRTGTREVLYTQEQIQGRVIVVR